MSVKVAEKTIRRLVEDGVYEEIGRLKKDIARLREAIKRESKKHISGEAGVSCCCELCDLAREGR